MDNQTQFHTLHNVKIRLKTFVKGRPNLTNSLKQTNKDHQHWGKANQTTVLPVSTQRYFDVIQRCIDVNNVVATVKRCRVFTILYL